MDRLRWAFSPGNLKVTGVLVLYAILLGILDLLSKAWAYSSLDLHRPVEVIGKFVRFTLVINYNTAFGLSFGENFPYALMATILAIFLFIAMLFERRKIYKFLYATILGGAIGNIVDRMLRGGVVDFLDVGIGNFRWYTFNLADVWVTLGIFGLVLVIFLVKE
ncbi:MAG: signal peptidase II [Thermotogae bacterium]|nr:signal peptidase II [Thermotogota bacterium]